jgi:hypothetical protein
MPQDDGDADRVFLRDEETVRLEFRAASHAVWLEFAALLGLQWDAATLGHLAAGRLVHRLGDLAKLRCLPDGRPLPASAIFECLLTDVSRDGENPLSVVERWVVRGLAGERRSERSQTPASMTDYKVLWREEGDALWWHTKVRARRVFN